MDLAKMICESAQTIIKEDEKLSLIEVQLKLESNDTYYSFYIKNLKNKTYLIKYKTMQWTCNSQFKATEKCLIIITQCIRDMLKDSIAKHLSEGTTGHICSHGIHEGTDIYLNVLYKNKPIFDDKYEIPEFMSHEDLFRAFCTKDDDDDDDFYHENRFKKFLLTYFNMCFTCDFI